MTPLEVFVGCFINALWIIIPLTVGGVIAYIAVEKSIPEDK